MNKSSRQWAFFLGGHDLEMATIAQLLADQYKGPVYDKHLRWGAKASDYEKEISEALAEGCVIVLIEMEDDLQLPLENRVLIDHHGAQAGESQPTSLHQVFDLLMLPSSHWTRWHELVAANDRAYIPGMLKVGASREEIQAIRLADRKAQGITEAEEKAAATALDKPKFLCQQNLVQFTLPHNRSAALMDRLQPELGGGGYPNVLVLSPAEINFFGDGVAICSLADAFPKGWYGGALPRRGFWGHPAPLPELEQITGLLCRALNNPH